MKIIITCVFFLKLINSKSMMIQSILRYIQSKFVFGILILLFSQQFFCAPIIETEYKKFRDELVKNHCAIPKGIVLPYSSDVENFDFLSDPLKICQNSNASEHVAHETGPLCGEIYSIFKNITCSNVDDKFIKIEVSEDVCSDFSVLHVAEGNSASLLQRLTDPVICNLLCGGNFQPACKFLLWSFNVLKELKQTPVESKQLIENEAEPDKNIVNAVEEGSENDLHAAMKEVNLNNDPILNEIKNQVSSEKLKTPATEQKQSSTTSQANSLKDAGLSNLSNKLNESPDPHADHAETVGETINPYPGVSSTSAKASSKSIADSTPKLNELAPETSQLPHDQEQAPDLDPASQIAVSDDNKGKNDETNLVPGEPDTKAPIISDIIVPAVSADKTESKAEEVKSTSQNSTVSDKSNSTTPKQGSVVINTAASEGTVSVQPVSISPAVLSSTEEVPLEKMEGDSDIANPPDDTGERFGDTEAGADDGDFDRDYNDLPPSNAKETKQEKTMYPKKPSLVDPDMETSLDDFAPGNSMSVSDDIIPSFPEQEDSHFFFYFLSMVLIFMAGYLLFHNKQKIVALIVEGRHERRRRSHGVGYKKLDTK